MTTQNLTMLKQIIEAIKSAESEGSPLKTESDILTGFSGNKLVGTLQRLTSLFADRDACYLEVGVFQGLTLLSVANSCQQFPCYGIDNFAYHDPDNKNLSIVNDRIAKLNLTNAHIINQDYEDALENLASHIGERKVGVYFVDGPHDYRSQLMCLELVLPFLHRDAVILVDDSNYRHVRQANRDFLVTHPEFKLVFESYSHCHPCNMTPAEEDVARENWWDGINIIVRDLDQKLQPMFPPTERSRALYENEHMIHAAKIAELAPQAVALVQAGYEFKLLRVLSGIWRFYQSAQPFKAEFSRRYSNTNTYSQPLPKSNYNHSLQDIM
jgi:hypothetical protein